MNIHEEVIALEKLNPLWSWYLCLATVVKHKQYTYEEIKKAFKVVPSDEYISVDKEAIIDYLYKISHDKASI